MSGRAPQVNKSELKRLFGARAQQALDLYTSLQPDQAPSAAWADIMGDKVFRIPALYLAEEQVRQGAPVWMYRFDWASPIFGGAMGAAHGLEIPFVWNGLDQPFARFFLGDAPAPQQLADIMHASWAAFVRSGDPQFPSSLPGRAMILPVAQLCSSTRTSKWSLVILKGPSVNSGIISNPIRPTVSSPH